MSPRLLCALALVFALAGCGQVSEVREPDVVISGSRASDGGPGARPTDGRIRIAVVTHGQASSEFWPIVRNGATDAGRDSNVTATYQSPDTFSVDRMRQLINNAVDSEPDGLVVSIPSEAVLPAIRRAVNAGIPVVSINSGSDVYKRVGILAHVGQPEERAGHAAGVRMAGSGVRRALCLNQEVGNEGLDRRCRGFARAMRAAGGRADVVPIDDDDRTPSVRKVRAEIRARNVDGVLALGGGGAGIALQARPEGVRLRMGTFDLSTEILGAVKDGTLDFAIDQQPYLQGYLPVVFLTQLARNGLFPAQGDVVPTGPNFVTKDTADKTQRLLRQGIR
jgi:simple sugar transport system substrate-binding protein